MLGFVFQLSATGVAQSVKIEKQLQSLETVFEQVESQTGLLIMFSNNELDVNRKVSLDVRKYTLEELLRKVLEGTNMDFDLEQNYVVIRPARSVAVRDSVVKTNKIKGVVVDAHGEPLPGVTVVAKRGEILVTGAASDGSGKFEIVVPADIRELSFTFVGYKTAVVPVELNKEMTIRMEEEVSEVDEVVVTGYFTKSKSSYTGAVKSVTAEQLKTVSGTNVVAALAALTPGLNLVERSELGSNPNHVPELLLRGMSSFSDGSTQVNQPTIVLDGVEISMQDLYDLDINEIENITVLKDASATALYGSRAASGVIVVERKKLAEGSMRVSYNFTGNVQFPYLKDYNMLNAAQKLEYERLAGLYSTEVKRDPWGNITNEGEQYALDKLYNERYQEVQRGVDTDWLSSPARTAFSHDHSLRLYGGASNVRYELSGRFNNVQGVMKEDYRRRYNLGFKLEYHVQNKLTMANRTTYSEVNYKQSPYGSFSKYVEMNPYDRIYNEFGEYNRNLSWDMDNPLYEASLGNYDISKDKSFSNTTDFRWEINKLFRLSGNFNITVSNSNNEVFKSPDSQDFKTETELSKKGSLTQKNGSGVSYAGTLTGAFNLMTDNNSLYSVNAGVEIRKETSESSTMTGVGFYDDALNFMGQAAGYSDKTDQKPTGTQAISTELGFFVNANYMYNNRYYADVVYRVTGSSKFGANNRYGNFWSAGLGWNIHNESFVTSSKIDILKIRGSLGYTGKVNFSPFQAMTMYQFSGDLEYLNGIGAVPQGIGNEDLGWERELSYNLGTDISLFDRRLNFTFDIYLKKTTDLVLDASRAPSTGTTSAKENIGEMENKGLEFQVDGMLVQRNDFYWQVAATGSMNRNRILKINSALKKANEDANKVDSKTPLAQYEEGESTTALKVVKSAGIDPATGQEVFIKLNGERTFEYSADDKFVIGDTEPRFRGTVSTNLFYKGFSLDLLGRYECGAYLYNETRATKVEGANPKKNADKRVFDSRWKNPGDIAFYKDIADSDGWGTDPKHSDRFVEKENVFTLGTVNFGYEFGQNICSKIGVRNLRVGVNLTDIVRWSNVKIERGTTYLYSNGFEFTLSTTF